MGWSTVPPFPRRVAVDDVADRVVLSGACRVLSSFPGRIDLDAFIDFILRIIGHLPYLAVAQIELVLLLQVERPGSDAAENTDLIATLVHGAVAVQSLSNGDGMAAVGNLVGRNQLRRRPRTEAVVARCLR